MKEKGGMRMEVLTLKDLHSELGHSDEALCPTPTIVPL